MNRFSALALLIALVLLPFAVHAQNVSVPLDDQPAPAPTEPAPDSTAPGTFVPQSAAPAPRAPPAAVRSQAPNVPTTGGSYAGPPVVQGLTPDQVAQARRAFEALAASNPDVAALNPFARFDALKAGQDLQKNISQQIRKACGLSFFNVNLPLDLLQNPSALENLKAYGTASIVSSLKRICEDQKSQETLKNSVGMFTIRHKAGVAEAQIEGGAMSTTFTYDFTRKEPPEPSLLGRAMAAAISKSGAETDALLKSFEGVDQDEMERRMQQNPNMVRQ